MRLKLLSVGISLLICFVLTFLISGCSDESTNPGAVLDARNNGFSSDKVALIFAKNCALAGCHAGSVPVHGLSLTSYENLMRGSFGRSESGDTTGHGGHGKISTITDIHGGDVIIPFDASRSLLYRLISGDVTNNNYTMPYKRNPLSASDIETIATWINDGAKNFEGEVPFTNISSPVFVCNQGSDGISVIDPDSKVKTRHISVDYNSSLNEAPHNMQLSEQYMFVTLINGGQFVKFSKHTQQFIGRVTGLDVPGMIILSRDAKKAWVSKSSTASGTYNVIYEINTESMTVIRELTIPVFGIPHGIAKTSNDSILIVANMTKDRITFINLSTGEPDGPDVLLSNASAAVHEPMHIYTSPDDKYLYIGCRKSNKFMVMDITTRSIIKEINLGSHPMQMSVTPDGKRIYVNLMNEAKIAVIYKPLNDWVIENYITHPSFSKLYGSDLSADGKYLYVTNSNSEDGYKPRYQKPGTIKNSTVAVISTNTNEVLKIIDVEQYATGITAR